MQDYRIEHIAYACADIDKTIEKFKNLGYTLVSDIIDDEARNVKLVFMINRSIKIEFVQPVNNNSPVSALLQNQKNSASPYHICYEVDDLRSAIDELKNQKFVITKEQEPAIAFDNRKVAFLFHKDVGLIELLEKQ